MTAHEASQTSNAASWQSVGSSTEDRVSAFQQRRARLAVVQVTPASASVAANSQRLLTVLNTWPSLSGATLQLGYAHVTADGAAVEALYVLDGKLSRFTYRLLGRQECIGHAWIEALPWREPVVATWVDGALVQQPYDYQIVPEDGWMQLHTRLDLPTAQVRRWEGGRWQRFLRWVKR